jgi:hypothetical protein
MAAAKGNDGVEVNQFPNIFRIMINGLVYFMEIETGGPFVTAEGASDLTNGESLLHFFSSFKST